MKCMDYVQRRLWMSWGITFTQNHIAGSSLLWDLNVDAKMIIIKEALIKQDMEVDFIFLGHEGVH